MQKDGEQSLNFTLDGDSADVDINQISGTCVSGAGNCASPDSIITLDITSDNAVIQINQKDSSTIVNLLLFSGVAFSDPIGDIVESTGVGQITRQNTESTSPEVGYDIELYDVAETVNGRMKIEFLDEEELSLIEHTIVYIDEVYYDPNPFTIKMSLRMVQGTARFASGQGNKIKNKYRHINTNSTNCN